MSARILLPSLALLVACGKPPERGERAREGGAPLAGRVTTSQGLSFVPDPSWKAKAAASAMRLAEFSIPRAEGDGADGEIALFYFGAGEGGSVEANLERWCGQFKQPDGSSSREKAAIEKHEVGGLAVTVVEVSGRYVATAMAPGQRSYDEPGWRLLAAIVETSKGPFFFKAVGPEKTIADARPALREMVRTVQLGG